MPGEIEKASETGLLAERQEATAVMDMIGQDFISRLGAANAGDAMKRMVGTSVVDGKYVAVRGMPDRYVNTLLNGGRLPSTDPDKRAINVDLFPGSILESINTYKYNHTNKYSNLNTNNYKYYHPNSNSDPN